jgi:hypothetical protein
MTLFCAVFVLRLVTDTQKRHNKKKTSGRAFGSRFALFGVVFLGIFIGPPLICQKKNKSPISNVKGPAKPNR